MVKQVAKTVASVAPGDTRSESVHVDDNSMLIDVIPATPAADELAPPCDECVDSGRNCHEAESPGGGANGSVTAASCSVRILVRGGCSSAMTATLTWDHLVPL